MEIKDVLIVSKYTGKPGSEDIEYPLSSKLESLGINCDILAGNKATLDDFAGRNVIISFGGDGTVLDASKNIIDDTPLLTVKSSDESIGALCKINGNDFGRCMDRLIDDNFRIEKWDRVEGLIDGKSSIALNEIYVGPRFSSGPGRYDIIFKGRREDGHLSSGIVASAGTGSTGWYANVKYSEGPFAKDSGMIKFAARDCKKDDKHTIVSGTIYPGEELEIISRYKFDGSVDFDGYYRKSVDFLAGKSVKIKLSNKPLSIFAFP